MTDFPNISISIQDTVNSIPWFLPEIALSLGFLAVIIFDLFIRKSKQVVFYTTLLTLLVSAVFSLLQYFGLDGKLILFNGMFSLDKDIIVFKLLTLLASVLSLLFFSQDERLKQHTKGLGDFYSIFIAAVLSMLVLISSANLLLVYISIEMLSLASYLMVSYAASTRSEAEAGLKYVLFGVAASALMLYGISFIYGFSGSLDLFTDAIPEGLNAVSATAKNLVLILFVAGIGFKLSFVPFHFWTPDAYQAAPTSITSFLSTAPKIAVFAFLFSINKLFHLSGDIYFQVILSVSLASMIIGNVMAVFQDDPKRLMAYSSIGHTGFLLMLFVIPELNILKALNFYLLVYLLMNIGAFLSFSYLEKAYGATKLSDFKGLGKYSPVIGISLVVFMVALVGLPPTAGFIAKFFVFTVLIEYISNSMLLTILLAVAVVTTVISLFYYFKIPLNLFLRSRSDIVKIAGNSKVTVFVVLLVLILVLVGVFPYFSEIY
jgi:NADH-quinone oxidoreductase subunit N